MRTRMLQALVCALPMTAAAQNSNPLAIPPLLDEDTFHLTVDEHVHQFYPGLNTPTYGVNGDFLGPTLLMHQGDTTHIVLHNELAEHTSMHWHGMLVPGEMDGGPPRMVMPGEDWHVKYKVKNHAATYWYHPHPHELTAEHVNMGIAGMIIVQDPDEAALDLPRTYGVDDIPVVIQDRRFQANGSFVFGPFGDSVLVNGTPRPYVELPAQVVRLRLLNGSNARILQLGFDDDHPFSIIGGDGGLLPFPLASERVRLSNGERAEILLDLTGMEGDSLMLMSHATELSSSMPGSSYILWESSALSGIDFPVLRIRVAPQTADPVTAVPQTLVNIPLPQQSDVDRTRQKTFSGNGMVGMGMFYINSLMFDMSVVNDTVLHGATEMWTVLNASDIAHPFHIHGVSFRVLDRDFQPPQPWEQGLKDMVLVDMAQTVRLLVKFDEYSNGWPFMYHCHNLLHEDNMMMLQFIVVDPSTEVSALDDESGVRLSPMPTNGPVNYSCMFPVEDILVADMQGRTVLRMRTGTCRSGLVDLSDAQDGAYVVQFNGGGRSARTVVIKE